MGETAIRLTGVSKRYSLGGQHEVKTALLHPRSFVREAFGRHPFWAVRDVTLEVERGEFLSIIGANGSGKSTLLRLIAGLSKPTEGTVEVNGRMTTLLELGSGFHPQVSGRDNAIVNGLLMGYTREEITALLPSIVEFAGLHEFIDQPMRTYSSGMYLRLGFAIAAHMEPEILIVDEVLAVGDAAFQERCFEKIEEFRSRGVTMVMVSHDMPSVERFSTRVALMERGRLVKVGEPEAVVDEHMLRYHQIPASERGELDAAIEAAIARSPEARAEFERKLMQNPAYVRWKKRQEASAAQSDREEDGE